MTINEETIDQEILKNLFEVVAEQLDVKIKDIKEDSSFSNDLGADSLDTVELVMAIEERFAIKISDEDAEKISTVREAAQFIQDMKKE